jgi:hypothetical protein
MNRLRLFPCALLIVAGALATVSPAEAKGAEAPRRPIAVRPAVQQDCPVSSTYLKSTTGYLVEEVGLRNASQNTVTSVTFGLELRVPENRKAKPLLVNTLTIPTNLKPGEVRGLGVYAITWAAINSRMADIAGPEIVARVGVTRVEFADAATWSYDLQSEGGFKPDPSQTAQAALRLSAKSYPCSPSAATPLTKDENDPYFSCEASDPPACVYCGVNGNSCTVTECSVDYQGHCSNCPYQVCQYHQ